MRLQWRNQWHEWVDINEKTYLMLCRQCNRRLYRRWCLAYGQIFHSQECARIYHILEGNHTILEWM